MFVGGTGVSVGVGAVGEFVAVGSGCGVSVGAGCGVSVGTEVGVCVGVVIATCTTGTAVLVGAGATVAVGAAVAVGGGNVAIGTETVGGLPDSHASNTSVAACAAIATRTNALGIRLRFSNWGIFIGPVFPMLEVRRSSPKESPQRLTALRRCGRFRPIPCDRYGKSCL